MKIVHLLAPADAGGLERVVHALAIGQRRAGHEVTAIAVAEAFAADHSFAVPLARENVRVEPVIVPGRAYRRERREVADLLRALQPDVVHSHGYHTDVVDGSVARAQRIATVSTAHGFTRGGLRNRIYEFLDCRALSRFDAVAAVSQPLADELTRKGVPRDRVHVIPNAWSRVGEPMTRAEARTALGLDAGAFVVAWVGRMSFEKGLDFFVDAMSELKDLPVVACAIGDGAERAGQQARADEMGLASRIQWKGMLLEAGRYFRAFDLLVLSSRTEGVPMVILEAMAGGLPLVAPSVGGIPAVLSATEALLVPSENPQALAGAIRAVFGDQTAAAARAEAARDRLHKHFDEGTWLTRYEGVYAAAQEHARRRSP